MREFEWWRTPYMASFRAGNFDFVLVTCHIRWGADVEDRVDELSGFAHWVRHKAEDGRMIDRDIIVMGDFNCSRRR